MSQSQRSGSLTRKHNRTTVVQCFTTGALSVCGKSSVLRLSGYHHFLLTGRCLSTSTSREETASYLWSTELCMGRERDRRQRETSANLVFGSHMYTAHEGKGPQFIRALLVCTLLTWRGSAHIPHKCWCSLDLSLSSSESGWLSVHCSSRRGQEKETD